MCSKVTKNGSTETRTLLLDGKEEKRWDISDLSGGSRTKTAVFENGEQTSALVRDRSGRLVEEELFLNAALDEKISYRVLNETLTNRSVYNAEGNFKYKDVYLRTSDGRIREIRREFSDGSTRTSSYAFSGQKLLSEYFSSGESATAIHYNSDGNILSKEEWNGEVKISYEGILLPVGCSLRFCSYP